MRALIALGAAVACAPASAASRKTAAKTAPAQATIPPQQTPPPEVGPDSWVMVELWPDVKEITYSVYFLEPSAKNNKHLCEMTKRIFDRDARARSKKTRRKFNSYRRCLTLEDARQQGLFTKR